MSRVAKGQRVVETKQITVKKKQKSVLAEQALCVASDRYTVLLLLPNITYSARARPRTYIDAKINIFF